MRCRVGSAGMLVVLLALAVGLGGCTEGEDAMARVSFLNFMRESPAFDPYEAPREAPERSVPVKSPGAWEPPVENTDAALRAWGDTMMNPLPNTDAVLTRGAEVFQTYCAVCHGVGGEGDGPVVGEGKLPMATDLMLETTVARTDGYLYGVIRVGRGLMPGYPRIPPDDRWAVVNYLRHLQAGGDPIPVSLPGGVQPAGDRFNTGADAAGEGQE
ncbi:MAG: c-type cytochrome [Gemmatimonadota bacterium]